MKRDLAIAKLKSAISRGDVTEATDIYIRNRISWSVYNEIIRNAMRPRGGLLDGKESTER